MTEERNVDVRVAEPDDLEGILACHGPERSDNPHLEAFLEACVSNGSCLVAMREGGAVGYVVMRPKTFFGRDFVELLMVHPSHRREGVGRTLLRAAVDTSETSQVFTSTNETNHAMQALLAQEGWTLSGVLLGLDEADPERVYYTRPGGEAAT